MTQELMATKSSKPINWASCHIEVKGEASEIIPEFPFLEGVQVTATTLTLTCPIDGSWGA